MAIVSSVLKRVVDESGNVRAGRLQKGDSPEAPTQFILLRHKARA
jgi:hypothetical protein